MLAALSPVHCSQSGISMSYLVCRAHSAHSLKIPLMPSKYSLPAHCGKGTTAGGKGRIEPLELCVCMFCDPLILFDVPMKSTSLHSEALNMEDGFTCASSNCAQKSLRPSSSRMGMTWIPSKSISSQRSWRQW